MIGLDNDRMPLRSRLLNIPHLRQRYLQYVREIAEHGLDLKNLGPVIAGYRELLKDEIAIDTRKLMTADAFLEATAPATSGKEPTGLHGFATQRRAFLLANKDITALPADLPTIAPRSSRIPVAAKSENKVKAPKKAPNGEGSLVINEVMAANSKSVKDPQGEYDDWIEIHNRGTESRDLSGMFLSDDSANIRKWRFPKGTRIAAGGYLVVWADEDRAVDSDLHANFKLSKGGETIYLSDQDDQVIDHLRFKKQKNDVAFGRHSGSAKTLAPTPAKKNRPQE